MSTVAWVTLSCQGCPCLPCGSGSNIHFKLVPGCSCYLAVVLMVLTLMVARGGHVCVVVLEILLIYNIHERLQLSGPSHPVPVYELS